MGDCKQCSVDYCGNLYPCSIKHAKEYTHKNYTQEEWETFWKDCPQNEGEGTYVYNEETEPWRVFVPTDCKTGYNTIKVDFQTGSTHCINTEQKYTTLTFSEDGNSECIYGEIGGDVSPNTFTNDKEEYNNSMKERDGFLGREWRGSYSNLIAALPAAGDLPHTKAEDGKQKPSLASIPPRVLEQAAEVMSFGASKYYKNKWILEPTTAFARVDSAMRHINKWLQGIDLDDESGKNHLDHAITQLIMGKEYINSGVDNGG